MNRLDFALVSFILAGAGLHAQTASLEANVRSEFWLGKTVELRIAVTLQPPPLAAGSEASLFPVGPAHYSVYGSITSVNGQPALGSWSAKILTPEIHQPSGNLISWTFDIFEPDGKPAGVITAVGSPGGPGLPTEDFRVVGSSNAYFGARGTIRRSADQLFEKGNDERTFVAMLIPLCRPAIAMQAGLPAIAHGKDFTVVTSNAPTEPGEILSLVAIDLLPELKESTTWPADPQALPNAPVTLNVDGVGAKILYVGTYPGARSAYQINFQVPAEVHAGIVEIQIGAGYIEGPVVSIPVR